MAATDDQKNTPSAEMSDDMATIRVTQPASSAVPGDLPTMLVAKPTGPRTQPLKDPSSTAGSANPDAEVPFVFGRRIAQGGMGVILEASDCKLGRTVAVKVMLSEADCSEDQKQRFIQEAAVLGRLEHPNIVPIHDLGRDSEGQLYYTMKLVKGRTLQHILDELRREHPDDLQHYTLDRLLLIFRKVCDALAFAHAQNIIHRDLKPENIMVGEFGEVLVMDWGISKILGEPGNEGSVDSLRVSAAPVCPDPDTNSGQECPRSYAASFTATMDGAIMGTPNYMSPEQAMGKVNELDERSDIFSLGGILYAILTLRPPVEGKDVWEVLEKVQAANITAPTEFGATTAGKGEPTAKGEVLEARQIKPLPHVPGGKVPAALSAVAMKALMLDKAERYQNVSAFSSDIEKFQGGFATSAEQAGLATQLVLLIKRNKGIFSTAAAAWLVITALAVWFVIGLRASERRATQNQHIAEQREAEAETQRGIAVKNERLLAGELTSQYVERSLEESVAGSWQDALWWAGEAYRVAREAGGLSAVEEIPHRYRIAGLISRLPKLLAVPELEAPAKSELTWDTDGAWVAAGLTGGRIQIFDPKDWSSRGVIKVPTRGGDVRRILPLGAGRALVLYGDNWACLVDLSLGAAGGESALTLERSVEKLPFGSQSTAVSSERGYFASLTGQGWLLTWDLKSGKILARTRLLNADRCYVRMVQSPDANFLAVSLRSAEVGREDEQRLFLLDPLSHRELAVVTEGIPPEMFFSPDGRFLIHPGSSGRELLYRDVAKGFEVVDKRELPALSFGSWYMQSFHSCRDGIRLFATREGALYSFRRDASGDFVPSFASGSLHSGNILVSPDEGILAGRPWGPTPTVRAWNAQTLEPLGPPLGCAGQIGSLSFSSDSSVLAARELHGERRPWVDDLQDGNYRLWRTDALASHDPIRVVIPQLRPQRQLLSAPDRAVALSPVGDTLLTHCPESPNSILVWDARRLIPLHRLACPTGASRVKTFGFVGAGDCLYGVWYNGVVTFFDPVTGAEVGPRIEGESEDFRWAEVSENGRVLVTSHNRNLSTKKEAVARFWSLPDGKKIGEVRSPVRTAHRLSPDGSLAYFSLQGGAAMDHVRGLYRVADGKLHRLEKVSVIDHPDANAFPDGRGMRFLHENRWFLIGNHLHQVEPEGFSLIRRFGGMDAPQGNVELAVDAREERAAIAVTSRKLGIFDLETGRLTTPNIHFDSDLSRVCFSPDGHLLATGTAEGRVDIWDAYSGKAVFAPFQVDTTDTDVPFSMRNPVLRDLHFNTDGSQLVIADKFGGAYLWNLPNPADLDRDANDRLTALAGNRVIGGEEHGRRLLAEEWHSLWKETPEDVRSLLLLDRADGSKSGEAGPWIDIFDGKSLNGWTTVGGDLSQVAVEEGAIRVKGHRSGSHRLFYTGGAAGDFKHPGNPVFRDFEWRAMVKTEAHGNSGLHVHALGLSSNPTGFEIQIAGSADATPTGSIVFAGTDEKTPHLLPSNEGQHTHPDGEWFEFRVRVMGRHITAYIDDQLVQDWEQPEDWTPIKGDDNSGLGMGTVAIELFNEGVWFKDIRVRRLDGVKQQ